MLRLRSQAKSPPGGFSFQDRQTSWRTHAWSFNQAWSSWYQENVRRNTGRSKEQCQRDVEGYCCEQAMKQQGWEQWVLVDAPPVFVPTPDLSTILTPAEISVIIPVYRPGDRLQRVIDSVKDQVNQILLVHDKASKDGVITVDPKVITVNSESQELGFGAKCNAGAHVATGKYLWFLNDDCYPNPHCADKLIDILTANPKIGAVGHLLRYPDGSVQHGGTHKDSTKVGFPHITDESIKVPTEMEAVTAASLMVKREAFDSVNGFDESYFLYLEDTDLCLRLRANGWKVYYTPYAEAVHEGSQSSTQRSDLGEILQKSVALFNGKWGGYMANQSPAFDSYESISQTLNIEAVYVHLVGDPNHEEMARRFVGSALRYPPGQRIKWVIALNNRPGMKLTDQTRSMFNKLGNVTFFDHDNSGWDIGAFQAYSKKSTAEFILFLGSSAYCRRPNWISPMIAAFRRHGPNAIYGVCGNLGDARANTSPHIRTTGWWCAPSVLNRYPMQVTTPQQRYPFEHGAQSFTVWAWSQGMQVLVVDAEGTYGYPRWNDGPNGFHRGTQEALLMGDRITESPYYHTP